MASRPTKGKAAARRPATTAGVKPITHLRDLTPDAQNANLHTPRGASMMETSLRECGFGDSLTVDRHGVVISGNQRLETVADIGLDDPIVVRSDGTRPIVHQRIDLEADDPRAKKLAIASNRVGEVNLAWDADVLAELASDDAAILDGLFTVEETASLLADAPEPTIEEVEIPRPMDVVWVLAAVPIAKWGQVAAQVDALAAEADVLVKTTRPAERTAKPRRAP